MDYGMNEITVEAAQGRDAFGVNVQHDKLAKTAPSILFLAAYWLLFIISSPVSLWFSFFSLEPNTQVVVLLFGRVWKVLENPGLYFLPAICIKKLPLSMRNQTFEINRNTVADAVGNPVIVSGVVTFRFTNSLSAVLNVELPVDFVTRQAQAVLKQVCSRYPYDSVDPKVHSLKSETRAISEEMVLILQNKVELAGVAIQSFELADLQYSPEIAQQMLMRQSAQALLDARRLIVEGATEIVSSSVESLSERNITLTEAEKARLVSTLIAVVCGDARVQNTQPVGGSGQQEREDTAEANKAIIARLDRMIFSMDNVYAAVHAQRSGRR